MADAMLQGEKNLSKPNLLRAIFRVMEESAFDGRELDAEGRVVKEGTYNGKGIDTVQFESAIKSNLQGAIDIHQFANDPNGEERAYKALKNRIYKMNDDGTWTYNSDNYDVDNYVQETSFEYFCMQQEVPEHFKNHSQSHGSQERVITPSDLDIYIDPNADHNDPNNLVYYEWDEPDGTHMKVTAEEFRTLYEDTIAENIQASIDALRKELHLNVRDDDPDAKRKKNIALSRILQKEILSSPRYGLDLLQACSLDKETGEFRIPKGDPVQAKRIEQLINSIIKNRINKQEIAGGPVVQVSNFGLSRMLHIRFKDKSGNLLPLEEEYNSAEHGGLSYKDFIKKNQGGIAYFECLAPIWSEELIEKFGNPDGTISVEAIEKIPGGREMLEMISYRIPTEDKYSCAPIKIVGFLPREAGEALMLPYELTTIDSSDFDVDKRYIMRRDYDIVVDNKRVAQHLKKALEKYLVKYGGKLNYETKKKVNESVADFMTNPERMKTVNALHATLYDEYTKYMESIPKMPVGERPYKIIKPKKGKRYRDNRIIDMTWAVFTHEKTADKILNPGGFDEQKRVAYKIAAYKGSSKPWNAINSIESIDDLKKYSYVGKDLTWIDTEVQFYRQNAAAGSILGVFAVAKVAHAMLENNGIYIDINELLDKKSFKIAGKEFAGRVEVDPRYDNLGNLVGKTFGSLVCSAADAVKDPILNLMNINKTTVNVFNTLLRLGLNFEDAALFTSQDVISNLLRDFEKQNLSNNSSLGYVLASQIEALKKSTSTDGVNKDGISNSDVIESEEISKEDLIKGLKDAASSDFTKEQKEKHDLKVLLALQKVMAVSRSLSNLSFATRFNSISSAVGPQIVDNLILERKRDRFKEENNTDGTHFYKKLSDNSYEKVDINTIFRDHPMLGKFAEAIDIAAEIFRDMPTGSQGFRNVLTVLEGMGIADTFYNDKSLMSDLAEFYQSYLLVDSGFINPDETSYYINDFPKEFIKAQENYLQNHPDNKFMQSINLMTSKSTDRVFLNINITGMDQQAKEELSSGWTELHQDNPELSRKLFIYCFHRAGVGFSPKTFISLVPTYVKERLKTTLPSGEEISYIDVYKNLKGVNGDVETVVDQFVQNNWDNSSLAPLRGIGKDKEGRKKSLNYTVNLNDGTVTVRTAAEIADVVSHPYIRVSHEGNTYLCKIAESEAEHVVYNIIPMFGENGEFIYINPEMTLDYTASNLAEKAAEIQSAPVGIDTIERLYSELQKMSPQHYPNREAAVKKVEDMKARTNLYKGFIQSLFRAAGVTLNETEAVERFKKLC
jgi:hypothetical protein